MAVKIGSARIDENGKAHGGAAGDQTGREVSTQSWYAHSKGWVLLRAKDANVREKIASCMEAACKNDHIGYDQYQRDTLFSAAKPYNFDVSRVTADVETDCSALVRVCVNFAGIPVGNFRTATEASVLMTTGAFYKYTDDLHCKKSTNLLRGDILVTRKQGHTVVVLSDGSNAEFEQNEAQLSIQKTAAVRYVTITGNTVNIRCGNGVKYAILACQKKGTRFPYVATSENGWYAVAMDRQIGWISGKYAEIS